MGLIPLSRKKRDNTELRFGLDRNERGAKTKDRGQTKRFEECRAFGLALLVIFSGCRPEAAPPREIDIHAAEYAFRAPATLAPGPAAFRLVNDGKFWHEVQLFRFRRGVSAQTAARYLSADSIPDEARDSTGSVLIAGAGLASDQRILVRASRGDLYGLICDFRDGGTARHAKLGMFALMRVE